jgi:hypothetical protein
MAKLRSYKVSEPIDLSHKTILDKLRAYCARHHTEWIFKLSENTYHNGLAIVLRYTHWLEQQPKKPIWKFHDNGAWLERVRQALAAWDGKSVLHVKDQLDIERYLSLLEFAQHLRDDLF